MIDCSRICYLLQRDSWYYSETLLFNHVLFSNSYNLTFSGDYSRISSVINFSLNFVALDLGASPQTSLFFIGLL